MTKKLRLAVAGIGNNISALFQGVEFYRHAYNEPQTTKLVGIRRSLVGEFGVCDVEFVAAFDVHPNKVGATLDRAILAAPNNYPRLNVAMPKTEVIVDRGIKNDSLEGCRESIDRVAERLRQSDSEVLLYSLPTGLQWAADAYATAALKARVAFVNCTPEIVARSEEMLQAFQLAGIPLIGDDLASHLGTSIVHRSLLGLLCERGISLQSSYQLNLGGNEDFKNLREHGSGKRQSKLNALAQVGLDTSQVEVIPSAGFVAHLEDHKVAYLNIEGLGWAGTPLSLDLKLKVQDSSNAAGVIIDLIRIGAASRRNGVRGFPAAATSVLKSPPLGHPYYSHETIEASFCELERSPALATG
jgi:myo-inositol-1-phosphate synthase